MQDMHGTIKYLVASTTWLLIEEGSMAPNQNATNGSSYMMQRKHLQLLSTWLGKHCVFVPYSNLPDFVIQVQC